MISSAENPLAINSIFSSASCFLKCIAFHCPNRYFVKVATPPPNMRTKRKIIHQLVLSQVQKFMTLSPSQCHGGCAPQTSARRAFERVRRAVLPGKDKASKATGHSRILDCFLRDHAK